MRARPFLSHKREDGRQLEGLRAELAHRGAAGWQDIRELRLGQRWLARFLQAIGRDTNGFIWWGTKLSLESATICETEIPRALRRSRRRWRRHPYPVVPLFVDLDPIIDRALIEEALGRKRAEQLLELHGVVREKNEPLKRFAQRAARQYVMDAMSQRRSKKLRVQITAGREPTLRGDLVLDWRDLVDDAGDPRSEEARERMVESLTDIRVATQALSRCPHIVLEPHLRVPLGALVGWEWNRARPMKLDILQVSAEGNCMVSDDAETEMALPSPTMLAMDGSGPVVIAISVGKRLTDTLGRYSAKVSASSSAHMHVPLERGKLLDGREINALAGWAVGELNRAQDEGREKHLILLGPVSLAVRIGSIAHGTGRAWLPLWDGESSYKGGIMIGGSSAGPGTDQVPGRQSPSEAQ